MESLFRYNNNNNNNNNVGLSRICGISRIAGIAAVVFFLFLEIKKNNEIFFWDRKGVAAGGPQNNKKK